MAGTPQPYHTTMSWPQLIAAVTSDMNALYASAAGAGSVTSIGLAAGSSDIALGSPNPVTVAGNIPIDLSAAVKTALADATTALQSISIATGTGLTGGPLGASGSTVALSATSIADLALAVSALQSVSVSAPITGNGTSGSPLALPVAITVGSFTGTLTGVTTTVTGTIYYQIIGSVCTLMFPASLSGTSNATSMTVTGLPSACQPATTSPSAPIAMVDNGIVKMGILGVTPGSGTITAYLGVVSGTYMTVNGSAFTASGSKGLSDAVFTYSLK